MALRDTFLNLLGANTPEVSKTTNSVYKSARDFLRNGNRDRLTPTWSDIQMSDRDMYRGYSYAVIQKRSNKVATLAKNNLKTWANPDIVDEFQKKDEDVIHPYLKLIADSTDFTEKQFWKSISIYMDLAGRYYLGVIRNRIQPLNPNLPAITTDPTKFIMLNPYEIRRVVDKNGVVAGYIERKKDGRYREWPLHQIIEMRELNPFDPENSQWAMTDAAKNAVYTINQSGDYTRQSLNGNIDAPGIITTDVLLDDEDFANFRARITQHVKGEPLFGNGTGAINWNAMQIDLDKAALMDINEINRTELFAVSGTSKTSLGIEQSGTTRETARVQSEQFISDTAQPRLEDIVDFLNLDYKKYYTREYKTTGYYIEVESAVGRDYDTEQKATELKTSQFGLAMQLIQSGYTEQSAYQFAEGKIDFEDLELEAGLDKPKSLNEGETPENPEEGEASTENSPNSPNNGPRNDSGSEDDNNSTSEQNSLETANNEVLGDSTSTTDLNELTPHSELVENGGKGSGNFDHAGRPGEKGGSAPKGVKAGTVRHQKYASGEDESQQVAEWEETNDPIYPDEIIVKSKDQIGHVTSSDSWSKARVAYIIRDKRVLDPFRDLDPNDDLDKKDIATYREYMKATFKIDDTELDRLLDNTRTKNSVEGENSLPLDNHEGCTCNHDHKVETFINEVQEDEGKVVKNEYNKFLQEIREIEKETIDACVRKVDINAFEESDIIGQRKKTKLIEKLKNAIHSYWWVIFPLFANNSINKRNEEFDEDIQFVFNNDLQAGVDDNAERVANGHMQTILNDILEVSNRAYTNVREEAAADLIVEEYKKNPSKFESYFEEEPTRADALKSIRRTDILEVNRKIYEKANKMAFEGYDRRTIVKAIREEYKDISEKRATLIAENETDRAFGRSQFEADKQFLNAVGKMNQAYKIWYSRRPANEQDKICDFCAEMIRTSNANPVPFEKPFLAYGDSMEVIGNDGKVRIFTANYEDIEGSSLHPRCQCGYHLVFKNSSGEFVKTLNGGKGSGNFGHSGRPGEVGGSAPTNMSVAVSEQRVNAKWLDEHRAFLRSQGYTDSWIDEQIRTVERQDLKKKALKAKTVDQFDEIVDEMKAKGYYSDIWWDTVGKATRSQIEAAIERKTKAVTPNQQEAIDNLLSDTGIHMKTGDEKWLRENVPQEMVEHLHNELNKAFELGLSRNLRVQFTTAQQKQGSCTVEGPDYETVLIRLTKNMMSNPEATLLKTNTQGKDGTRWWTCEKGQIAHTITHELGHALVWQALKKQGQNVHQYNSLNSKIVYNAKKAYAGLKDDDTLYDYSSVSKKSQIKLDELRRNEGYKLLSQYGGTNAAETIAESYSNPNYSEFTKEVYNQLIKALKG